MRFARSACLAFYTSEHHAMATKLRLTRPFIKANPRLHSPLHHIRSLNATPTAPHRRLLHIGSPHPSLNCLAHPPNRAHPPHRTMLNCLSQVNSSRPLRKIRAELCSNRFLHRTRFSRLISNRLKAHSFTCAFQNAA